MNTVECIKTRRSVRNYNAKEVSNDTIKEVIDVSRMAPSWKNTQTVRYVVVKDESVIDDICTNGLLGFTHNADIIKGAAALVVIAQIDKRSGYEKDGSFTTSKERGWEMFDAGISTQTFCLAAHEKGLGTCVMGIFDDEKVAEAIHLPEGETVAALVSLGYFDGELLAVPRKDVDTLTTFI